MLHLDAPDRTDKEDSDVAEAKTDRLKEKIAGLKRQMQSLKEMGNEVEATPGKQISLTDPDARSMATSGRGTGMVGYNVQIAVDTEHHLIVAHEVINEGHDRTQLATMGKKALEATGQEEITALADRGYYKDEEVLALEGTGVLPCVPKTQTSNNPNRGLFSGDDFIYDAKNDHYTCPAREVLTKAAVGAHRKHDIDRYRNLTACLSCELKPQCAPDSPSTRDNIKQIRRWMHEGVLDKMQARLDRMPEAMTIRRQTVEHTFGTLKAWMGATHFLTKTQKCAHRDELAGAGLQYQSDDQHVRSETAHRGNRCLTAAASNIALWL